MVAVVFLPPYMNGNWWFCCNILLQVLGLPCLVVGMSQDAIILSFLPKDVDTTTLLPALQQVFDQGRAVATEMRRLEQEEGVEQPVYQINRRRKQFRAISNELNQVLGCLHYALGSRQRKLQSHADICTRLLVVAPCDKTWLASEL